MNRNRIGLTEWRLVPASPRSDSAQPRTGSDPASHDGAPSFARNMAPLAREAVMADKLVAVIRVVPTSPVSRRVIG
jgi:hypothetical protein